MKLKTIIGFILLALITVFGFYKLSNSGTGRLGDNPIGR